MRNLQYQLANGMWSNCDRRIDGFTDRTEEFLTRCEKNNGMGGEKITFCSSAERPLARDEVLSALESGRELRNDSADWYGNCRYEPAPVKKVPVEMVECDCGCNVPRGSVMNASLGTSCCDCYDRLSD